jgi:hypothetical protein
MNEWGVPDWQAADNYGDVASWNINRWRWKFLRRRDDLPEEFDAKAPKVYEERLAWFAEDPSVYGGQPPLRPDEPGFHVSTRSIRGPLAQPLPNPRIGEQPFFAMSWTDLGEGRLQHFTKQEPNGFLRFDFDLSKPLEPQIEVAKSFLAEEQRLLHGKTLQRPKTKLDKWLMYLRILDAKAARAKWIDIAAKIEHLSSIDAAKKAYKRAKAWEWGR